ncbi:AAA family ATPase [bacterium]|jgi:predicted AAA+ superfamily ATPase|nr:AAA family ATPase [bacterium]
MKAKDNPYRVERIHSLPFLFSDQDFDRFYQVVEDHNFRGAIVGPHGSGKTTLVENLIKEFQSRQIQITHCRLKDDGQSANYIRLRKWIDQAPSDSILILDSAGLLSWWKWRGLLKESAKYKGLIITTHQPGRLTTLINTKPTFETLQSVIVHLKIAESPSKSHLIELFNKHRGNIRECLRELYDEFAGV